MGKSARRGLQKNAVCLDEYMTELEAATSPADIRAITEEKSLLLARVTRTVGCGNLEVTLQDGKGKVTVPIGGAVKFRGKANNKTDRANCMCAGDVVIIRGGIASGKLTPAGVAHCKKLFDKVGMPYPAGFFSPRASAIATSEELGAAADAEEDEDMFDRSGEAAAEAYSRARAVREAKTARGGAGASADEEDSDVDVDAI
jgi:hypothetical protein